jgi:hypothetical protein
MDPAKRWYSSAVSRAPLALRLRAGNANLVLVDGI